MVAALISDPTWALERLKDSLRKGARGPMLSLARNTVREDIQATTSITQRYRGSSVGNCIGKILFSSELPALQELASRPYSSIESVRR